MPAEQLTPKVNAPLVEAALREVWAGPMESHMQAKLMWMGTQVVQNGGPPHFKAVFRFRHPLCEYELFGVVTLTETALASEPRGLVAAIETKLQDMLKDLRRHMEFFI